MNFKWAAEQEADSPNSNVFFSSGQWCEHHRASVGALRRGVTAKATPDWWRFPCGWRPSVPSNPAGLPAVQRKSLAHDHHPLPHRRHPLRLPGQRHHHDALHARYHQVLSSFVSRQSVASYSCYLLRSNAFSQGLVFFFFCFFWRGSGLCFWSVNFLEMRKSPSAALFPPLFGETFLWRHKGHLYLCQIRDHTPRQVLDPPPLRPPRFWNLPKHVEGPNRALHLLFSGETHLTV